MKQTAVQRAQTDREIYSILSLGKYGIFPSNLLIERPFHLIYEVQDRQEGEDFCRLRVVPGAEAQADMLTVLADGVVGDDEYGSEAAGITTAVDRLDPMVDVDEQLPLQTLAAGEIELLKQTGLDAGRDLITRLMMSHTGLDRKTTYSLAKYRMHKTRKYLRRFTVLPLNVSTLASWILLKRDPARILEFREETLALMGCWADVHFADTLPPPLAAGVDTVEPQNRPPGGRWLVVDDVAGLLVAYMAESMGILCPEPALAENPAEGTNVSAAMAMNTRKRKLDAVVDDFVDASIPPEPSSEPPPPRPHVIDYSHNLASANTLTVLHANSQPNLFMLRYFGFDFAVSTGKQQRQHALSRRLFTISWLQLLEPELDPQYTVRPVRMATDVIDSWKTNRRSTYHRKHRRWHRLRHTIDSTRAGGFSGLAVASTMDLASILRHALPLLAGGAPVAVFSPTIEALSELADCFSKARRSAWIARESAVAAGAYGGDDPGSGSEEFPVDPTLLLGVSVQTSRVKRWQVLPGRTHPLMTAWGGAEGYVLTGWKTVPTDGFIAARGKFGKKSKREAGGETLE